MRLEYWIIAIYMLFLVAMGYVQRKLNKDTSDYFRSGCKGTWWLVGSSAFMSGISAWSFTAAAGVAFEAGFSIVTVYLANAAGFFLSFLFTARWFRQLRATTAPDVINMRFGRITQQFYAWISVIQYCLLAGLPLYGLAVFCAAVFGLDIYMVIIVLGSIVVVYATTGGKWAIMSNDFLQGLVLFSISILVAFLSFYKIGGFGGFWELVQQRNLQDDFSFVAKPGHFAANSFTWGWVTAMFFNQVLNRNGLMTAPAYFSVKDGSSARKAALCCCILTLVGSIFWFFPPMVARLLFEQEVNGVAITKPAEAAYAIISMKLLPQGLVGLVIVAMFAATTSSLDSGVNTTSAIVVKNIYPVFAKLFRKNLLPEKGLLLLGQISTIVAGACITITALLFAANEDKGIFEIELVFISLLTIPLTLPMVLCLFVRKVPGWAAVFTVSVSFIASLIIFFSEDLFGRSYTFQQRALSTFAIGTIIFIGTRPFWRWSSESYKQKVKNFFELMYRPVDFEKEVGKSLDTEQFRTIGLFSLALGLLISGLLFVSDGLWAKACVIFIAGFVLCVGLIMVYLGRSALKKEKSVQMSNEHR